MQVFMDDFGTDDREGRRDAVVGNVGVPLLVTMASSANETSLARSFNDGFEFRLVTLLAPRLACRRRGAHFSTERMRFGSKCGPARLGFRLIHALLHRAGVPTQRWRKDS